MGEGNRCPYCQDEMINDEGVAYCPRCNYGVAEYDGAVYAHDEELSTDG